MFVNWYFSDFKDVAEYFLGKFKWGSSFTSLNQELLDRYAACKTSLEVVAVQNEYLETARQEKIDRLSKYHYHLFPSIAKLNNCLSYFLCT